MLISNLISARTVCPSRLKDWWLVISCSDLQKTSQRFYKTDWQHRRLEILAWPCVVNISQMQGKFLFHGRQQLRLEIKTKQRKQQTKEPIQEKKKSCYSLFGEVILHRAALTNAHLCTLAHICAEAQGENISGLLWRHIVKKWLHLEAWWDDTKVSFFFLLSAFLSLALSAHTHSTFIKKNKYIINIQPHLTARQPKMCNVQAQRCIRCTNHWFLSVSSSDETDRSWHPLYHKWAETNPPQSPVCHLYAVALEANYTDTCCTAKMSDRQTTKTSASCTNTTTQAEFSENLHELLM